MLLNLTISTKLKLNSVLLLLGLFISGLFVYSSLNNLSSEYKNSSLLAKQNDTLKSVYLAGLLFNSSSGVVFQNPNSTKAKNTMGSAISQVEKFTKVFKRLNIFVYEKLESKIINHLNTIKPLHRKVSSAGILEKSDMKSSLKAWRALKFAIIDELKIIQKNAVKSQEEYDSTIKSTMTTLVIIMLMVAAVIFIFNIMLSKSIVLPLNILEDAMTKLLSSSNGYSKINISTKDETAQIAHKFNKYLDKLDKQIKEDCLVIDNVQEIVNEIKIGKLSSRVQTTSSNKNIMELVLALNTMLDTLHEIVDEALIVLNKYKDEDFTAKTKIKCKGEVCELLNGIDLLGDTISKMLVDNKKRGVKLEKSSNILLENVNSLDNSSTQAASSIEETAAALEELTANVKNNSQKVQMMSQFASNVTSASDDGQDMAVKTTKSMDEINEEVIAINEAIIVVDQIAFQTNILSLNAAVEAATAGEAGKGFAVVASEVRNLANRSAEAATQIKTIVESATNKANEGKKISDKMIEVYTSLNENIDKTIKLISEVSISSKEQEEGIVQINDSINELDQKTQQNANIASISHEIALSTGNIASQIVKDTDEKKFLGK